MKHDLTGKRVRLIRCNDPYTTIPAGTEGTVGFVDDTAVHVLWDNGSRLGLVAEDGDPVRGAALRPLIFAAALTAIALASPANAQWTGRSPWPVQLWHPAYQPSYTVHRTILVVQVVQSGGGRAHHAHHGRRHHRHHRRWGR